VAKNPSNPAHVNKWDLGSKCYNPLDMTHTQQFACDGSAAGAAAGMNIIKTFIQANEFLGYTADQVAALQSVMSAATATTVGRPAARISTQTVGTTITLNGSASLNAVSWAWTTTSGVLSSATDSVTTLTGLSSTGTHTVTLTVANSSGVTHKATIKVVAQASMLYTAPTASIDCSVLSSTVTCTDASTIGVGDIQSELKIRIVWGDGNMSSVMSRGATATHTYADGTYTLYSSATGSTTKLSNTNADSRNIYGPFTTPGGITLGAITGTVTDNSVGVGGVVVSFYRTVADATTGLPVTQLYTAATTSTNGTYSALLSNATYTVTASKGGYTFSTVTDAFVGAGTSTTRDFSALHTISGRIAGAPAGTVVELTNGAAGIVAATSTNANGTFTLSSGILTSGTYTVDPQPSTGTTSPDLVTGVTVTTLDRTGIDFTYYAP